MKVFLGADHRGFRLKNALKNYLEKLGFRYEDLGNTKFDPKDDYPDFAFKVAKKVAKANGRGILLCGSGEGMAIAANKIRGIRAAVAHTKKQVKILRDHNDINVLCLSSWEVTQKKAMEIVKTFLTAKFSNKARHKRRIEKIKKIER